MLYKDGPAASGAWGMTDFSNGRRRELVTFVSEHFHRILSSRGGSWSICKPAESYQNTVPQHIPSRLSSFVTWLLLRDSTTSQLNYFATRLLRDFILCGRPILHVILFLSTTYQLLCLSGGVGVCASLQKPPLFY